MSDAELHLRNLPNDQFVSHIMENCIRVARKGAAREGPGCVVVDREGPTHQVGYKPMTEMDDDDPMARKVKEMGEWVVPLWPELGIVVVVLGQETDTVMALFPRWSAANESRGLDHAARID